MAIDIGAAAIDRSTYATINRTYLSLDNPAEASGVLDTMQVWAYQSLQNFKGGTLFLSSGTTYECRDAETLGVVASGSMQEFTGLSCDIESGDYIAGYGTYGKLEASSSGYAGFRYSAYAVDALVAEQQTDFADYSAGYTISLYGMGTEGGGATEKFGADTGTGADARASGNPAAAVSGGESGSGADSLPAREIALPEAGSGVDALVSLQTPAAKTASDAGSGVEGTPLSGAVLVDNETGIGVDALVSVQTPVAKTSSDNGSGVEAVPIPGAILAGSESGSAIEAFIARLLAAAETGSGIEASEIGGGGLLKHLFASELGEGADGLTVKIEMSTKGGGMRLWT